MLLFASQSTVVTLNSFFQSLSSFSHVIVFRASYGPYNFFFVIKLHGLISYIQYTRRFNLLNKCLPGYRNVH